MAAISLAGCFSDPDAGSINSPSTVEPAAVHARGAVEMAGSVDHRSDKAVSNNGLQGPVVSRSLAKRAATAKRLYESVDPIAAGIDFRHVWAKRPGDLRNNTTGAGLCMGDYDGDGLTDVFLCRSTDGGRLYRNLGDFRFRDVTSEAGIGGEGRWTTGATFVDIDNDHDLDLYVCGYDCPNHLYINQGDGRFLESAEACGLNYKGSSAMMAFADYDLDGDLDGYLVTNHIPPKKEIEYRLRYDRGVPVVPQEFREYHDILPLPNGEYGVIAVGQYDHLYRNNGDGTFTDVSREAGISGNHKGLSATWWDYNQDGFPDLYVANDFYGPDRLYVNKRDGTFTDSINDAAPHTPWFSMGSDLGDINNDGLIDFFGTDMSAMSHYRSKVTMGDIQDDGWFLDYPQPRQYMRNAVYLNTGTTRLLEIAQLCGMESTNWTWTVKLMDLDEDGLLDVYFTNGMSRDWGNTDLKQQALKLGAMNSDKYNDFWDQQAKLAEENLAFRNLGDLRFQDVSHDWGLDTKGVAFGAAFGDLDNDGDLDLVVNNFDDRVSIYRNENSESHHVLLRLQGTRSNRWGIGALVHLRTSGRVQSRYLTLSRGFMSADDPRIHFGLGSATRIDELTVRWPSGTLQRLNDLEVDCLHVITEPGSGTTAVLDTPKHVIFERSDAMASVYHIEEPFDDFARQPLLPWRLSQMGPGIAVGDVNDDGRDDIFIGGAKGSGGWLMVHRDNDRWTTIDQDFPPWQSDSQCEDLAAIFFDADGDDDLDLYVVSGGVECDADDPSLADRLYVNEGGESFAKAGAGVLPDLRDSGSSVVAADYDRDGDLDLFVGGYAVPGMYPMAASSRLLQNNNGTFLDATTSKGPGLAGAGMVTSAVWSDVDADGWLDLIVASEWGAIRLFRNTEGQLHDATQDAGLTELTGWWHGIATADLDNDGDIDFVATNIGLNTRYHPAADRPFEIYLGDFAGLGKQNIVETFRDHDGRRLPLRSKADAERAMPFIGDAFPTQHDYAQATADDIYTPKALADTFHLSANTAASMVFINDGHGHFVNHELPFLAQDAPGYGIVLEDFDLDGNVDIFVAQNSFAPHRETGRFDGGLGLLMHGHGDGRFTPVWPNQSGLVIPEDAKSAVAIDVDDNLSTDILIGVNNGKPIVYRNIAATSQRPVVIRLKGPAGNREAVGARISWTSGSNSRRVAEICSGGGYFSQASRQIALPARESSYDCSVVWPDGKKSEHQIPGASGIHVITAPDDDAVR